MSVEARSGPNTKQSRPLGVGGASNLGRRLLPICGVTSRPPDGGRSKSDCPSIVDNPA